MIRATTPNLQASNLSQAVDNVFLRNLVEQSNREKAVFFSAIETLNADKAALQAEKASLQAAVDSLKAKKDQLIQERETLRRTITHLQYQHAPTNPYGVIGGNRIPGARGSWPGPTTSRASSMYSDPEQETDFSVVPNLGPNF